MVETVVQDYLRDLSMMVSSRDKDALVSSTNSRQKEFLTCGLHPGLPLFLLFFRFYYCLF